MNSEESYNPYHSSHVSPDATLDHIPKTFGVQTMESTPTTKKRQAWMLLIVPALLLTMISALFCIMLLWLLYPSRRVNFDSSFESVTKGALIVDEADQWCQLLAIASHSSCNSKTAPSLL